MQPLIGVVAAVVVAMMTAVPVVTLRLDGQFMAVLAEVVQVVVAAQV
jgi:hypothetical protein